MQHPTPEEWMEYLYGELPPAETCRIEQHLERCAECRAQVAQWRQSMAALDRWQVTAESPPLAQPKLPAPRLVRHHLWRWAAAAVFMVGLAFALGRWSASRMETSQIEARLHQSLRREMLKQWDQYHANARELLLQCAAALAEARQAEQQAVMNYLQQWAEQHQADLASLRRDLETVALATEDTFRQTHQQLSRLAHFQPAESPR